MLEELPLRSSQPRRVRTHTPQRAALECASIQAEQHAEITGRCSWCQVTPITGATNAAARYRPSAGVSDEVAISHWEVDVQLARRPPSKSHAVGCEDGAARNGQYPVRTTAHWQPIHNASQRKLERRRPRRATARHERRGPLKVEDVAARNGPPPVTNDEARVVVILVSKLECLERSATVVVLKVVVSSARDRTAPPVPGSIPPPATTLAEKEEERC